MLARIALIYLLAVVFFAWGLAAAVFHVFPWQQISGLTEELKSFTQGDEFEQSTLSEKIASELVGMHAREITKLLTSHPQADYKEVTIPGARDDFSPALMVTKASDYEPMSLLSRYRFGDGQAGITYLDEQRQVVHTLRFNEDSMNPDFPSSFGPWQYEVLDDGSAIVFSGGASGLHRLDICGQSMWSIPGYFNHDTAVVDGLYWVLGIDGNDMDKDLWKHWNYFNIIYGIDVATGEIKQEINLYDVMLKNLPDMDPLAYEQANANNRDGQLTRDIWHFNKVAVLSSAMAGEYPDFEAGDLLLSARNQNLTMIIDPKSLQIKWYSVGETQVHHDPEWIGDNKISVYNNRQRSGHWPRSAAANNSEIKHYDFDTGKWNVHYNAAAILGYTAKSGGHEYGNNGRMLMQFDGQGRLIELDQNNNVIWEYVNRISDDESVRTRGVRYISASALKSAKEATCSTVTP